MTSEITLQQRVHGIIAPYADSEEKPPFTEAEMIVMILLLHGASMANDEIFKSIYSRFRYYQKLAYDYFLFERYEHDCGLAVGAAGKIPAQMFFEQYKNALKSFEVPLIVGTHPELNHFRHKQESYSVDRTGAQTFLARVTGDGHRAGTFPFFRLPTELRETIYELVFQYPVSGLRREVNQYRSVYFCAETRSLGQRDPDRDGSFDVNTMPIKDILAPLRVNRQMHREALPYFYELNHFRIGYGEHLMEFLYTLAPERRKYITTLVLPLLANGTVSYVEEVARALSKFTGLKTLRLIIDEKGWLRDSGPVDPELPEAVRRMPWVGALERIHGLTEVTFHGCPSVEALLREGMMRPRKSTVSVSASSKRKIEAAVEADSLRRSGRIKKQVKL